MLLCCVRVDLTCTFYPGSKMVVCLKEYVASYNNVISIAGKRM